MARSEIDFPRDPVNRFILFRLVPGALGLGFAVYTYLYAYVWNEQIPSWASVPELLLLPFLFAWSALDEWRSRRHSDGEEHGWVWQTTQRLAPRQPLNRRMALAALGLIAVGRIMSYVKSGFAASIGSSSISVIWDVVFIVPIAAWLVVTVIRWGGHGWHNMRLESALVSLIVSLGALAIFVGLAAMSDAAGSFSSLAYALSVLSMLMWGVVSAVRWAGRSIIRRDGNRPATEAEPDPSQPWPVPPSWW